MTDDEKNDPDRPKRIAKLANDLSDYCGERQQYHAIKAQEFGYSQGIFKEIASTMKGVPDDPLLSFAEMSLQKFRNFIQTREEETGQLDFDVSSGAYALGTALTATASMIPVTDMSSRIENLPSPKPPRIWSPNRIEQYAARLQSLDLELGRLARSVWQSFYGGAENAERDALLSMRQLYDHFFDILAPDDDVRQSPFFTVKKGGKPNQVHRKEKIRYTANMKIHDKKLGQTLESQADYVLELYERLNKLHKRGRLDQEETQNTLAAMQAIIEEWTDALRL